MNKFRIALLQMAGHGLDQDKNLEQGIDYCRRAGAAGADLALFPEMWNTAYAKGVTDDPDSQKAFRGGAITVHSPFFKSFQELARELKMGIGLAYLEAYPGQPRNSVSIIDKEGNVLMTYAKIHTCDFGALETSCRPGDDFYVCEFPHDSSFVKLGAMICYDREAPESARILMLKGAEIVLTPNACRLESKRLDQFRVRAFENVMGMAMTNYAAPIKNGHSIAFDETGNLIVEADESEGVFMAEFDLDEIRNRRKKSIWGNAFRRPHRYGLLSSMEVDEPFIRKNAFGADFDRLKR